MIGAHVECHPKMRPFTVNRGSGYSNPDIRWRWCCAVCPFTVEDKDKDVVQRGADGHNCAYGWCAIPMTPERAALLGRPHIPEPTKEDRVRWQRLKERNRIGARTADRVVDLPRRSNG